MKTTIKPYDAIHHLPCTALGIVTGSQGVLAIDFLPVSVPPRPALTDLAELVCAQLDAYVADPRFRFELPLAPAGTEFQRRVWLGISAIPAGTTLSYGELAARLGSVARAVGQACGDNPIPIVVPCHRVLSSSGWGGFNHQSGAEMLSIKQWLLWHEGLTGFSRSLL
ncbi:methylated-DNA--[protein]-cysteine S-methyltransferase [Chitinivorax sp. PXF-14]|uniref:methylated-DNA--[protein]-cysteine S-methyltransferase n=1 Tax=Chitinivorax sp. PXF-14 TaxID=3230488 RepID=UPI0034675A87